MKISFIGKCFISFFSLVIGSLMPFVAFLISRHYQLVGGEYFAVVFPVVMVEMVFIVMNIILWQKE